MPSYTQTERLLHATTPLGEDVLLLARFTGREELSRPFAYHLEFLSESPAIAARDVVGKGITWTVRRPSEEPRPFHGLVRRFVAGPYAHRNLRSYRAEVVPWLWFLTRSSNCRIFQNLTAPDIIAQVCRDLGFSDFTENLSRTYAKREYTVQYRETAFHFVTRLMEEEGIYYYFRHEEGRHTLVLGDAVGAYADCDEKEVPYTEGSLDRTHVSRWEHAYDFRSGRWAHTDYNFEKPSNRLLATTETLLDLAGADGYEQFDYPGLYAIKDDGVDLVRVRMEEEETPHSRATGVSDCCSFGPGHKFTLSGHDDEAENQDYVLTEVEHEAHDGSYEGGGPTSYSNRFACIPAAVPYRPERTTPRPVVRGPQTAVVVGPKGEEIYTDKHGRVKVQFHWDREGQRNEKSSCWVRVSQGWAGKQWGMVFLPRIDQEVVVSFLEGDPDRPLITGRVYNAEQMPPYALPDNRTQSGIKTRSSPDGDADHFNELRFEDRKGEEDIYFHAERDFHRVVENDDDVKVGHDQTIEVKNQRTEVVKEGDETITIEKGKRTVNVKMGDDEHNIEKGNRAVTISLGNDELKIKVGNQTTKLDVGKSSTEAMLGIELKVGQSSIKLDQSGVTIQGMMVKVKGQVMTEVAGTITQIKADAMLQAQGGIVMIG